MSFITNKKLIFFNANGEDMNFEFDSINGIYKGSIYLPTISTYLFHSINIFIYEIFDISGNISYGQPQDIASIVDETLFRINYVDQNDKRFKFSRDFPD